MKGHKIFLRVDFIIQTILILGSLYVIIIPIENLIKIIVPILPIWLIIASTINKVKYNSKNRFLINRVWFFTALIFLIGGLQLMVNSFLIVIFSGLSWLSVLINYILVIFEYLHLRKKPFQNLNIREDILDDNNF